MLVMGLAVWQHGGGGGMAIYADLCLPVRHTIEIAIPLLEERRTLRPFSSSSLLLELQNPSSRRNVTRAARDFVPGGKLRHRCTNCTMNPPIFLHPVQSRTRMGETLSESIAICHKPARNRCCHKNTMSYPTLSNMISRQ